MGSTNFIACDTKAKLYTPDDIMNDGLKDLPASNIVVYDDDHFYIASCIAELLAKAGHSVQYITPLLAIATWTDNTLDQQRIIDRLASLNISMHPNTMYKPDGKYYCTLSGNSIRIEHSTVVFVGARKPVNDLYSKLLESDTQNLYRAGDCVSPGLIQAAVLAGHSVAKEIISGKRITTKREQIAMQLTPAQSAGNLTY